MLLQFVESQELNLYSVLLLLAFVLLYSAWEGGVGVSVGSRTWRGGFREMRGWGEGIFIDNGQWTTVEMIDLTADEIRDCIHRAVQACQDKDAIAFSQLFLPDAEVLLSNGTRLIGRTEIARVTATYFERCGEIAIAIHRIVVEGSCAGVEWSWQEGQLTENAIAIEFQQGAISCWREYRRQSSPNL